MNETEKELKSYKLQYKIFAILGTLVLFDAVILKSVGIPFIASLILYPLLSLLFKQDLVFTILGLYGVSWFILFIPAIVLNRKIKKIEALNRKIRGLSTLSSTSPIVSNTSPEDTNGPKRLFK